MTTRENPGVVRDRNRDRKYEEVAIVSRFTLVNRESIIPKMVQEVTYDYNN